MKSLSFLLLLTMSVAATQAYSAPTCSNASSDPDGDGWGWENNESCQVQTAAPSSGVAACSNSSSDPDGDGWGWENGASCQVLQGQGGGEPQVCTTRQSNSVGAFLVGDIAKFWSNGSQLRVRFINGSNYLQDKVMQRAQRWSEFANITFVRSYDSDADIRIAFRDSSFPSRGSWSYVGIDSKEIPTFDETMHFGWLTDASGEVEIDRVVVHEFGHALGMQHEHQSPRSDIPWNRPAVYAYYLMNGGWGIDEVNRNIFQTYSRTMTNSSAYDPYSIMHYPIDASLTTNGYSVSWNTVLSATDKSHINKIYPKALPPVTPSGLSDGLYSMKSRHSQKCFDLAGNIGDNGSPLQQWSCNGLNQQKFYVKNLGAGLYTLTTATAGKCVTASGARWENGVPMVAWDCYGGSEQKVSIVPSVNGYYTVRYAHTGKCMDVEGLSYDDGQEVHQWDCVGGADQDWSFNSETLAPNPGTSIRTDIDYSLVSRSGNKCLDVRNYQTWNGAPLQQTNCSGSYPQRFRFRPSGEGSYAMVDANSGRCVSTQGARYDNGAPMVLWDCHEGQDQRVTLVPSNNGSFTVRFAHSNKCMDVWGNGTEDGAEIHQWDCVGVPDQDWILRP